jgi:hypothetical protein
MDVLGLTSLLLNDDNAEVEDDEDNEDALLSPPPRCFLNKSRDKDPMP